MIIHQSNDVKVGKREEKSPPIVVRLVTLGVWLFGIMYM